MKAQIEKQLICTVYGKQKQWRHKVNKALKLLESSNKRETLPLTDRTFNVLLEKHLKASKVSNDIAIEERV